MHTEACKRWMAVAYWQSLLETTDFACYPLRMLMQSSHRLRSGYSIYTPQLILNMVTEQLLDPMLSYKLEILARL
jgi:hypothetical protein